jgi:hypothetical protein
MSEYTEQPKPCPHCGSDHLRFERWIEDDPGPYKVSYELFCDACSYSPDHWEEIPEATIKYWNTRPIESDLSTQVELQGKRIKELEDLLSSPNEMYLAYFFGGRENTEFPPKFGIPEDSLAGAVSWKSLFRGMESNKGCYVYKLAPDDWEFPKIILYVKKNKEPTKQNPIMDISVVISPETEEDLEIMIKHIPHFASSYFMGGALMYGRIKRSMGTFNSPEELYSKYLEVRDES